MVVGAEVAGWVGENVGDATGSGHKLRGKLRIGQKPEGLKKKCMVVELALLRIIPVGAGGSGPAVEVEGQFLPPDITSSSVVAKE